MYYRTKQACCCGAETMRRAYLGGYPVVLQDRAGLLLWGRNNFDGHDELQNFGRNNPRLTGEMGRGVVLPPGEKARGEEALLKYNVNVLASDLISLNRQVPDSRPVG